MILWGVTSLSCILTDNLKTNTDPRQLDCKHFSCTVVPPLLIRMILFMTRPSWPHTQRNQQRSSSSSSSSSSSVKYAEGPAAKDHVPVPHWRRVPLLNMLQVPAHPAHPAHLAHKGTGADTQTGFRTHPWLIQSLNTNYLLSNYQTQTWTHISVLSFRRCKLGSSSSDWQPMFSEVQSQSAVHWEAA